MKESRIFMLVLLCLLAQSCSIGLEDSSISAVDRPSVSYLEEDIPPCTPIAGSELNPCISGTPARLRSVDTHGSLGLPDTWPTMTEHLSGVGVLGLVSHIVVSGTVIPSRTRCALYPKSIWPSYLTIDADRYRLEKRYNYHCFVDVRVNEYIVGDDPPELTVSIHRESLRFTDAELKLITIAGLEEWVDDVYNDPGVRTASAYEGKELVLFLGIPFFLDVETWSPKSIWFVQRDGDEIRAVSEYIYLAMTPEHYNSWTSP